MVEEKLTIQEQIFKALDGRTQRWLSLEIKMPESELSKRMNGKAEFTREHIKAINERLNTNIPYEQ